MNSRRSGRRLTEKCFGVDPLICCTLRIYWNLTVVATFADYVAIVTTRFNNIEESTNKLQKACNVINKCATEWKMLNKKSIHKDLTN